MTNSLGFLSRVALLIVIVAAASALPAAAGAQAAKRSQFIVTKGKDTVAVELFSRDGNTLTGEIYQTNGPRTQYTLDLKKDSSVQHVEMTRVNRAGQSVGISLFFLDSVVKAQMSAAGNSEQFEFPSRRAAPFLAVSFAMAEQLVQATHLAVGKSTTLTVVRLGAADTATVTVNRFHADSASLTMPDVEIKLALSTKNEVVGGLHVGQNWSVERKNPR